MDKTAATWGKRITLARCALGLSQEDVALLANCSQSTVSRVELGQRGVSDQLKKRIAKALHTDVDELFAFDPAA